MVHLEKLKCQFNEFLVVMVTYTNIMWIVGKWPPSAYLHSWHSANVWNVLLRIFIKSYFP